MKLGFLNNVVSSTEDQSSDTKRVRKFNPNAYENFPPMSNPPTERECKDFFMWLLLNETEAKRFLSNDREQYNYIFSQVKKFSEKKTEENSENASNYWCSII